MSSAPSWVRPRSHESAQIVDKFRLARDLQWAGTMKSLTSLASLASLASLVFASTLGCSGAPVDAESASLGEGLTEGSVAPLHQRESREGKRRTFLTRNVYLGFAVEPVLGASSVEEVPGLVAAQWNQMERNDFVARAKALAGEIAATDPEAVGLQEVALLRRFPASGAAPTEIDYLTILQRALTARGLHYRTAVVQRNTDVSVPMFAGFDASGAPSLDGVQIVDRDVVLVRDDLRTSRPESGRFQVGIPVDLGGASLEVVRGWASVVVHTNDGPFRFVTTHLEDLVPEVQLAQASELVSLVSSERAPVVLVGDLNARPSSPTVQLFQRAGFVDAWARAEPRDPGFTCCQGTDLSFSVPLTERIDYVLARHPSSSGRLQGQVTARIVGSTARERTTSGLWPSDHAGVAARFPMPEAD